MRTGVAHTEAASGDISEQNVHPESGSIDSNILIFAVLEEYRVSMYAKELPVLVLWVTILFTTILPSAAIPPDIVLSPIAAATSHSDYGPFSGLILARAYGMNDEWGGVIDRRFRLRKRHGLSILQAEYTSVIVPNHLAIPGLKLFYNTLLACVQTRWQSTPPLPEIALKIGNLHFRMSSATPIPWDFIIRFSRKMLNAAILGFAGTYEILYADEDMGQMVTVTLKVVDHSAPGEARSDKRRTTPAAVNSALSPTARGLLSHAHKLRNRHLSITKRGTAEFSPIQFQHLAMITPVRIAALYLEDFYDTIAMRIETGFWTAQDPLHYITFQQWNFQLSFYSYAQAVPWDFIQNFVIDMSDYAAKGFTSEYNARFGAETAAGQILINVWFRSRGSLPGGRWSSNGGSGGG